MIVEPQKSKNTSVFHIQIANEFDASVQIKFTGCWSGTY